METMIGIAALLVGAGVLWLCFALGVYFFTRTGREACGSSGWRTSGDYTCRPSRSAASRSRRRPALVGAATVSVLRR